LNKRSNAGECGYMLTECYKVLFRMTSRVPWPKWR